MPQIILKIIKNWSHFKINFHERKFPKIISCEKNLLCGVACLFFSQRRVIGAIFEKSPAINETAAPSLISSRMWRGWSSVHLSACVCESRRFFRVSWCWWDGERYRERNLQNADSVGPLSRRSSSFVIALPHFCMCDASRAQAHSHRFRLSPWPHDRMTQFRRNLWCFCGH